MASLNDQLNKLKDQLAKENESREAAEARAEAKAEARADEQRKQHEALLKILSQLQSPSGHGEAKNQDTPVQEAPVAGDDGEMSPSNDGGSAVPAKAETEWDQLGGRGQARDFSPIVELSSHTHSGRGVNMHMAPPVLKDRKGFPAFREQVKVYAKCNRFESVLTTESYVDVGSDERDVLLRRGVSSVTCDRHLRAWAFFSIAFELPTDIGRFRRSTSPKQFWENTVKWHIPQTAGQQVTLRQQLTNFQVPKTSDPVQKLLEIEDISNSPHPPGSFMAILQSSFALVNACFTSRWYVLNPISFTTTTNIVLTDAPAGVGGDVWSQFTPFLCMNPFATRLAFVFVMFPSLFDLYESTHRDPMAFSPSGSSSNTLKVPEDKRPDAEALRDRRPFEFTASTRKLYDNLVFTG